MELHPVPPSDQHVVAPDGWRRGVIGVALGALFGGLLVRLVGASSPRGG